MFTKVALCHGKEGNFFLQCWNIGDIHALKKEIKHCAKVLFMSWGGNTVELETESFL